MSIPYTDWALLAPYPAGDNVAAAQPFSWLHFDLTQGDTGSGWVAWNSLPTAAAGYAPNLPMPAGAIPIQVAYDPASSLVTITTPGIPLSLILPFLQPGWANLSGVWIRLPDVTTISSSFIPPQAPAPLIVVGNGDLISGDFSHVTGSREEKFGAGHGAVFVRVPVGNFNQPWLAIPIAAEKFE